MVVSEQRKDSDLCGFDGTGLDDYITWIAQLNWFVYSFVHRK